MTMIVALAAAIVVALMLPGRVQPATGEPAVAMPVAVPSGCDWNTEYYGTLASLGENDLRLWSIYDAGKGNWGNANDMGVNVSPEVPCNRVRDVIRHEHAHMLQLRAYGSLKAANWAVGGRIEIVADCASKLLGSQYTPYVLKMGGCTDQDYRDARVLVPRR